LLQEPAAFAAPEMGRFAFVFNPFVSSPLTTSAKFAVICESPLTQCFNEVIGEQ